MKKLNVILLIISFVLSGLGGIFLFGATTSTNDSIQTIAPSNKIESEEITEYTYKTYDDYFADIDFSNSNITGTGSETDPYKIHSTEEFLHLLAGQGKYLTKPKHNLPSEYTEVRYLRSTGTQYIDTGVALKQSIRVESRFASNRIYVPSGTIGAIFGAVDTVNNITNTAVLNSVLYASHGVVDTAPSISLSAGMEYHLEFKEEGRWYLNNKLFTETYEKPSTGTSDLTMWLFGRHLDDGTAQLYTAGNLSIHEFKFYDGSELIHHYIPCYRKADTKPGMYDIIAGEFLTNSGTGEFEYGYLDSNVFRNQLNSKYVELYSDIVLNDETFDENGNPSGGDGIVYSWQKYTYCNQLSFNGRNHKFSGLYFNDTSKGDVALFSKEKLKNISNLIMDNTYIHGDCQVAGFCFNANLIDNCKITNSFIKGASWAEGAGIAVKADRVVNCENYANVSCPINEGRGQRIIRYGGILAIAPENCRISNCKNYGKIYADGLVGGIVGYTSPQVTIENCVNYGTVYGVHYHIGGIVGIRYEKAGSLVIKDTINYGDVITEKSNGSAAGFIGTLTYEGTLINCVNYGYVYSMLGPSRNYVGEFMGNGGALTKICLQNCKSYSNNGNMFIASSNAGTFTQVPIIRIKNCAMTLIKPKKSWQFIIVHDLYSTHDIEVDGLRVIVDEDNFNRSLFYSSGSKLTKNIVKNVIIEGKCKTFSTQNYLEKYKGAATVTFVPDGILLNMNVNGIQRKEYIGSDFSGFYFSWRTGKLGLVALDGRGQFQGAIDEEWLTKNGYTKKSA